MQKILRRSPQSLEDALTTYMEIAADNAEAAEAFLDAVDALLDRLQDHPKSGQRVNFANTRLSGLRVARVSSRFCRYLVFYLPMEVGVHVLRILDRSRDVESLLSDRRDSPASTSD